MSCKFPCAMIEEQMTNQTFMIFLILNTHMVIFVLKYFWKAILFPGRKRYYNFRYQNLTVQFLTYALNWKHPPFSAHKEENGDIYARGSQDMKLVGIQYMEAIRELLATGWKPKRDIHISWVPDEEIGGHDGVELMLREHRAWFDKFNIGFELDEGLANPEGTYRVFYSERSPFWIKAKAVGTPGHGSAFIKETASERLHKFNSKVFEFRREQENLLESNKEFTIGDVTTVNWTISTGGVQPNVVPAEMEAVYDFRVTPTLKADKFMDMIESWARDIGGIEIEYVQKTLFHGMTEKDDQYWQVMKKRFERIDIPYKMEIFPAATDANYSTKIKM